MGQYFIEILIVVATVLIVGIVMVNSMEPSSRMVEEENRFRTCRVFLTNSEAASKPEEVIKWIKAYNLCMFGSETRWDF